MGKLKAVGSFIARVWGWLDSSRRFFFNLLWLLLLVLLVWTLSKSGGPELLQDKTTLVLDLQGRLVEQHAGSARDRAVAELRGDRVDTVQLRDVLRVLEEGAKDKNISQLLIDVSAYAGAGPANQGELAAAVARFKASGKKVYAYGEAFDQRGYQIAVQADQVFLHPMGLVLPEGFGRYRNYYKDLFERVGVSANVLRVGKYKNFGEPYFANGPSPATLESEAYLYDELWAGYVGGVEAARKLEKGAVMRYINSLPEEGARLKGDYAALALQSKLIDGIKTRDEVRQLLIERGAANDDKQNPSFRQIGFKQYLARLKDPLPAASQIGVVVAEGGISDGSAGPGAIGGDSTAALIRQARNDERIKAVVLRVNSPGGSALASEIIRKELELTRKAGKPVVVSMGDVAASGGYWISMSADEVIADPATITGSIGVFGMLPTADKLLAKAPVHVGGYGTTWLVGAGDPRRPFDPRVGQAVQAGIEHIYTEFTSRAAQARGLKPEDIDAVGQGRVWTGKQALERKLVDRTGSFADAVAAAAKRAKLEGTPQLRYVEKERSRADRLIEQFAGDSASLGAGLLREALGLGLIPAQVHAVNDELQWLTRARDAKQLFSAHVHCLCTAP